MHCSVALLYLLENLKTSLGCFSLALDLELCTSLSALLSLNTDEKCTIWGAPCKKRRLMKTVVEKAYAYNSRRGQYSYIYFVIIPIWPLNSVNPYTRRNLNDEEWQIIIG